MTTRMNSRSNINLTVAGKHTRKKGAIMSVKKVASSKKPAVKKPVKKATTKKACSSKKTVRPMVPTVDIIVVNTKSKKLVLDKPVVVAKKPSKAKVATKKKPAPCKVAKKNTKCSSASKSKKSK